MDGGERNKQALKKGHIWFSTAELLWGLTSPCLKLRKCDHDPGLEVPERVAGSRNNTARQPGEKAEAWGKQPSPKPSPKQPGEEGPGGHLQSYPKATIKQPPALPQSCLADPHPHISFMSSAASSMSAKWTNTPFQKQPSPTALPLYGTVQHRLQHNETSTGHSHPSSPCRKRPSPSSLWGV